MWMNKKAVVLCLLCAFSLAERIEGQSRSITFHNYCPFPVWYGFVSGATGDNCGGCPAGSSCNSQNGICFWNPPTSNNGNYKLLPNASSVATVTFVNNGKNILWSGAIAGRTGCDSVGVPCQTADCGTTNHDTQVCKTGFQQPATEAEMTMLKKVPDVYDVEVINGINIPVELKPKVTQRNYGYTCGNPGGAKSINDGLGPCTWEFDSPSPYLNWVKAGGPPCRRNSDCAGHAGTTCGLNADGGNTALSCGKQLGWYSADQVCGMNRNFGLPFNCPANTDLFECVPPNGQSCYSNGAGPECCGCVNWQTQGIQLPNTTTQCKAMNGQWVKSVLPFLKWMKTACPTLYTFPYDDPSSTFTCGTIDSRTGWNTVNYEVTFCPTHRGL